MKTKLSFLIVFALLAGVMFNPGTVRAEAGSSGTVVAWGRNVFGEASVPAGLTGITAIATGGSHTMALKRDGTVIAWGDNNDGQSNIPTGLGDVSAISAGWNHSLALKADGTVVAWGSNAYGQASVPAGLSDVIAISAGAYHNLALKADGTVVAWGHYGYGEINVPEGLSGVTAVAGGAWHSLVLKADGTVVAWGSNYYGETTVPAGLSDVIAIAAGASHSLALKADGTMVAWGRNDSGQCNVPEGLSGVIAIEAGEYHSLALKADGTMVAWGLNEDGEGSVPAGLSGITTIAAGGYYNLAIKTEGAVATGWGNNYYGQTSAPTGLSNITALSTGWSYSLALKADGTVVAWGDNGYGQTNVPTDLSGVTAIATGFYHSLAVKSDGTVVAWGWNDSGQINVPTGLSDVVAVSGGYSHSLALKADGTVVGWGNNYYGQSGVPAGLSGVIAISAGYLHSLALKADGTVVAWGINGSGQGSVPTGLSGVTAIASGGYHNLALKSDGTVVAWGGNAFGQGSVPATLSGVTAIAAGYERNLVLKANGTILGWGYNGDGQRNVPAGLSGVTTISEGGNFSLALVPDQDEDGIADAFDNCPVTPNAGQTDSDNNGVGDACQITITTSPVSQVVYASDAVSFSAVANGDPAPSLQWQVSMDAGATWTNIADATSNPLTFTASLSQNGYQYRAVFNNGQSSATSNAATLTVNKKPVTVTTTNLTQTYDGQPKPVTVTTEPVGKTVVVTYNGSPTAPTAAGSYIVVATVNDTVYEGSASGTLNVQPKAASVTPDASGKIYGEDDPVLTGTLDGFLEADDVTATYNRTAGEAAGSYTISATLNPSDASGNYDITYNTAAFAIDPRLITVTADAKSKLYGEADPELTYEITSGSLLTSDSFSGALSRDAGENGGDYAITQGTLSAGDNYALTFVGAVFTITSDNTAPVANPGGPYLGAINTTISFNGSASSDPEGDALNYAWDFGDSNSGSGDMPAHSYANAGIYSVCLTVDDGDLNSAPACTFAVIYDPNAGFVTGGGWINSPAGAYKADASLTGQATFGFVSKYKKGATVPTGTTQFQFSVAGFSFYSETYEWLVVNKSGTNAQFKGSGLINGAADPDGSAYKFMLWAGDGSPDTFRIRIWWEDAAGEHDVYDNGVAQAIGGGSIVMHTK